MVAISFASRAHLHQLAAGVALVALYASPTVAYPVSATFAVDAQQSFFQVTQTSFGPEMAWGDFRHLTGSMQISFDVESTGGFASVAPLTIADASFVVPHLEFTFHPPPPEFNPEYSVDLGLVSLDVDMNDPPTLMTLDNTAPLATYRFDSAALRFTVGGGIAQVGGSDGSLQFRSFDFDPIIHTPNAGFLHLHKLTLAPVDILGLYSKLDATLEISLDLGRHDLNMNGPGLEYDFGGRIVAHASFWVALAGVPGDFDEDGDADADDLTVWIGNYGSASADGANFLAWQLAFGMAPPPAPSVEAIASTPEPPTAALLICCAVGGYSSGIRSRRHSSY
jgi:hypothetical protein